LNVGNTDLLIYLMTTTQVSDVSLCAIPF